MDGIARLYDVLGLSVRVLGGLSELRIEISERNFDQHISLHIHNMCIYIHILHAIYVCIYIHIYIYIHTCVHTDIHI